MERIFAFIFSYTTEIPDMKKTLVIVIKQELNEPTQETAKKIFERLAEKYSEEFKNCFLPEDNEVKALIKMQQVHQLKEDPSYDWRLICSHINQMIDSATTAREQILSLKEMFRKSILKTST